MSNLTVSFPGRHGDILWALPTIRALATIHGPIRLVIAGEYGSLVPLLEKQVYLSEVIADPNWKVLQTAPMTPWAAPAWASGVVLHLGHRDWPTPDLPRAVYQGLLRHYPHVQVGELDLTTPWIATSPSIVSSLPYVAVGFTDEHFELKYGVDQLAMKTPHRLWVGDSPRWRDEALEPSVTWEDAAIRIVLSRVFLGCCSALHVLAVAMGIPVVMMEPNPHRHNDIFYPVGKSGPQVTLVLGNDNLPTFDSRAVRAALEEKLR